jgi:hypothetical protein
LGRIALVQTPHVLQHESTASAAASSFDVCDGCTPRRLQSQYLPDGRTLADRQQHISEAVGSLSTPSVQRSNSNLDSNKGQSKLMAELRLSAPNRSDPTARAGGIARPASLVRRWEITVRLTPPRGPMVV